MYKQSILRLESPLFIVLKREVVLDVALVALITFCLLFQIWLILGTFVGIFCVTACVENLKNHE
jgi:hypothetical protein